MVCSGFCFSYRTTEFYRFNFSIFRVTNYDLISGLGVEKSFFFSFLFFVFSLSLLLRFKFPSLCVVLFLCYSINKLKKIQIIWMISIRQRERKKKCHEWRALNQVIIRNHIGACFIQSTSRFFFSYKFNSQWFNIINWRDFHSRMGSDTFEKKKKNWIIRGQYKSNYFVFFFFFFSLCIC